MNSCEKCLGTGLIGQGPNPHLREGRTVTCDACHGTGSKPVVAEDAAVDSGAPIEPKKGATLFSRIFGK